MLRDDDLELMHTLAFFYWRRNQPERATALAYAAFRLGKADGKLLSLLAMTLLDLGLPERTLAILDHAVDIAEPQTARSVHYLRARALLRLGHAERAREEFRLGLEILPPRPRAA